MVILVFFFNLVDDGKVRFGSIEISVTRVGDGKRNRR